MNTSLPLPRAFTRAALALALGLGLHGGAWAQQSITLTAPLTLPTAVCGNSSDTATGYCSAPNASDGNTLTIGAGVNAANYNVFGRYDVSNTAATSATGNTVNYSGSQAGQVNGAYALSGLDGLNATADGNTVTVSGAGASASVVYGGNARAGTGGAASASGNRVEMTDGVVANGIIGGNAVAPTGAADALNNVVEITGGTVSNGIAGGMADAQPGGATHASNNKVSISGGTVSNSQIFGGFATSAGGGTGTAADNTVEIKGSAVIGAGISLYGGSAATTTGNTLELYLQGVTVDIVHSFQNLNFHIPASLTAGQTMLTIHNGGPTSMAYLAGTTLGIEVESGSPLKAGDQIVLIDATADYVYGSPAAAVTSLTTGYAFEIVTAELANQKLVARVVADPSSPAATPITTAAVTITAPATGNSPSGAATVATGGHYTAGAVTWSPTDDPFVANATYTATVTLTADAGYTFAGLASTNATLNGQRASTMNVSPAGGSVTLTYVFPPLAPRGGGGGGGNATSVPTLGETALLLLALLLAGGGAAAMRRGRK